MTPQSCEVNKHAYQHAGREAEKRNVGPQSVGSTQSKTQLRMARRRKSSANSSTLAEMDAPQQELDTMYDYLAKVILLGPSGAGK